MAKKDDIKIRVIAVYRLLSDGKRHTSNSIADYLFKTYGIEVDRKTLIDDVRAVNRFFPVSSKCGVNGGYIRDDVLKSVNNEPVYHAN